MTLPGVAELRGALRSFRADAFRLETLQEYADPAEVHSIAAFRRGDPDRPPDPAEDQWLVMLRAHRDAGRVLQRVHVVTEPISDYLAYELCWEYGPHAAAGEDIRILPVTRTWPDDVPHGDFWLLDSTLLFGLNYDRWGTWLGAELITDPAEVIAVCLARDAALHQAMPWAEYIAGHPELVRRLPQGIRP